MEIEYDCPSCGLNIELEAKRYESVNAKCPECLADLIIEYDSYFGEDLSMEFDLWTVRLGK
ncbi:hypothetical protein [Niabella aurantiaca]|uniref:hypothetical protein n=1 Tax=Niabella aurantiaca TaxID=379900 RepID=UPI00035F91D5|nr:hypothetical protein [Niabella aurantiaca]